MTTVTTVVLDLGNVLVGWDPRRVWSPGLDDAAIETFLSESRFAELNRAMDAGRRYADVRDELERSAPHHLPTFDAYWTGFARSLTGPVPDTAAIVEELRAAGVRLLGLTNWSAETYHHAAVAAPAITLLEDVLVSGREGLAKPDPAIFRLLVDRYRLEPPSTLFVDDSPANVEAAREAGIQAHEFVDAATLRSALRERGIAVADRPGSRSS